MNGYVGGLTVGVASRIAGHVIRHGWGIVATVLAMIAMSGAAYAVSELPPDSVGTAQLRAHAVTVPKLSSRAVRKLHGARGARGPRGTRGPAGPSQILVTNLEESPTFTNQVSYDPISHITVPAGTWEVTASALVYGPSGGDMQCAIDGSASAYTDYPYANDSIPAGGGLTATVTSVFRTRASLSVTLACRLQGAPANSNWGASDIQMIARRVDTASTQN